MLPCAVVAQPKLLIADLDELRRSLAAPPPAAVTSAVTSAARSAAAMPPVAGADFHDALLMHVTGLAPGPLLPVVLTSSDR